ncbi:hypothetical protein QUC31_001230 [Theobroma cacao]|nr:Dim1 family - like 5 [Theobroma cacao]
MRKEEVGTIINDTIDKVLVLHFECTADAVCLQLDNILAKATFELSKFTTMALVDIDFEDAWVFFKYFNIA